MKTLKSLLIIAIISLTSFTSKAQNKQDQIRYAIELADEEYKDIIRFNMKFTETETSAFWPLMDGYLKDRDEVFAKEVNLYMTDYSKMTNEKAEVFIKKILKSEGKMKRIKDSHFNKISKVLPAKKFLRFMQVDNFVEAARNFKLSSQMPLIKG